MVEVRNPVWLWAVVGLMFSLALTSAKWAAFALTGSAAVLSDAIESFVNVLSSSFVLYAVWLSSKPRDDDHPYGHGKVEYFSAGFEGALVLFAAVSIGVVGVLRLLEPQVPQNLGLGAIVQSVIAFVTLIFGQALIRAGKRYESPSLVADGVHVRSDAVTTVAVVLGMLATWATGYVWMDAALAVGVAVWLFVSGVLVVREAVGGLMDEANPELLGRIGEALEEVREPGWIAPHHGKVHRLGRTIHVDLHMVFPRFWSIEDVHDASKVVDARLIDEFGEGTEVMLHMESCTSRSCTYCDLDDCPMRDAAFVRCHGWTADHVSSTSRPEPIDHSSSLGDGDGVASGVVA